jgi:hypothetical protein
MRFARTNSSPGSCADTLIQIITIGSDRIPRHDCNASTRPRVLADNYPSSVNPTRKVTW